jgi:hypothetical protein
VAVNEANFVMGPADLYIAPVGTAAPASTGTTPAAPWVNVGATTGGIKLELDETVTALQADQVLLPVGGRVTAQAVTVTANMSEITLANIAATMASGATMTSAASGADASLQPVLTNSASQPNYVALLIRGWAPRGATSGNPMVRQMVVYKTLPETKSSLTFDKATPQVLAVTFNGYYVSTSQVAWEFQDATDTYDS